MDRAALADAELGGRYRLHSLLGSGGMALVYDGWDERLARPVAVKLLRHDLAAVDDVRRRFETEARAAARLTHPNVVAVYDAGDDGGRSYIVMERLGGESLADSIARGPLDVAWLRRLAGEVLAALAAAHQAGIVHRDIKPSNILIGAGGLAKVADFGIALDIGLADQALSPASPNALTSPGCVAGTTAYLAPERVMGQAATAQSDLYSLGVVLYEALTGSKPFEGATPVAVAAAAIHGGARDPSSLRPDADPQLVEVIGRALAVDPAYRYASATDMAADLRRPPDPPTAIFPAVPVAPGLALAATLVGPAPEVGPAPGVPATPGVAAPGVAAAEAAAPGVAAAGVAAAGVGVPGVAAAEAAGMVTGPRGSSGPRPRWGRPALVGLVVAAVLVALAVAVVTARGSGGSGSGAGRQATTGATAITGSTSTPPTSVGAPGGAAAAGPGGAVATGPTTPAAVGDGPLDPRATMLEQIAARLSGSDSPAAGRLAAGLTAVAGTTDPAARAAAASNLLAQSVQWYRQGQLTTSEYALAAGVLRAAGAPNPPPISEIMPAAKHKKGDPGGRAN